MAPESACTHAAAVAAAATATGTGIIATANLWRPLQLSSVARSFVSSAIARSRLIFPSDIPIIYAAVRT